MWVILPLANSEICLWNSSWGWLRGGPANKASINQWCKLLQEKAGWWGCCNQVLTGVFELTCVSRHCRQDCAWLQESLHELGYLLHLILTKEYQGQCTDLTLSQLGFSLTRPDLSCWHSGAIAGAISVSNGPTGSVSGTGDGCWTLGAGWTYFSAREWVHWSSIKRASTDREGTPVEGEWEESPRH